MMTTPNLLQKIIFATGDPDKFPYGISQEILVQLFSYIDDKKDNARSELVNKVWHKYDAIRF